MTYDFYLERKNSKTGDLITDAKLLKLGKNKEEHKKNIKGHKGFGDEYKQIKDLGIISTKSNSEYEKLITISFTLKKPYISSDDDPFYVLDNPVCKDKVFKVPMVRASSWKGKLRWVAYKILLDDINSRNSDTESPKWEEKRARIVKLFGNEKDAVSEWADRKISEIIGESKDKIKKEFDKYLNEQNITESGAFRGRLNFYPTFFDRIGLDVIAPHDRKTKTVRNPIYFETVPEGTGGELSILYYPFDLIAKGKNNSEIEEEKKEDMKLLKRCIPSMLCTYGFGAKTTSGYGVVKEGVDEIKTQLRKSLQVASNE